MIVQSDRLGELEVADDCIINFPYGLPGFREVRQFAFIPFGPDSPFVYMQALDDPYLVFIGLDTFAVFTDYTFEMDDDIAAELGLTEDNRPQIFSIVTVPEKLEMMTANLLAPVLVNWRERIALQYVLEKTDYLVKQRIFPHGLPKIDAAAPALSVVPAVQEAAADENAGKSKKKVKADKDSTNVTREGR